MALRRDIAPGQNHIALRKWGRSFYSPQLFHLAPTADRIVPLAIRDLLRAKTMLEVYGVQGLDEHAKGCVLVNNYPIKTVKIFGRVLSSVHKNYDMNGRANPNNFYIITVDDCSGDVSHINIKIPESCIFESFNEDSLVEIVGHVLFFQDYLRQIIGERLTVLSIGPDLAVEIECWKLVLATRRHLKHPWQYKPDVVQRTEPREPKFSKRDYLHRLEKQNLRIIDPESQIPQVLSVSDSFNMEFIEVTDSDVHESSDEMQLRQTPRLHTLKPDNSSQCDTDIDENSSLPFDEPLIIVLD